MPLPYRLRSASVRAQHLAVSRFLQGASHLVYRFPLARPGRFNVEVVADVPYQDTGSSAHTLDVYRPLGEAPEGGFPVVFYTHGGGFAMLSKDTHRLMALSFAKAGYVVFNINYRLGYRNPFPTPLADTSLALAFAVRTARLHGGDPARFVLAGESAGGNLTLAMAVALASRRREAAVLPLQRLRADGFRPVAVVPVYGMLDLTDLERLRRGRTLPAATWAQIAHAAESYLGGDWSPARALAAPLASPLRIVEDAPPGSLELPPFFVPVGTRDPLLRDSTRLAAALTARGVSHELCVHEGELHGYNALLWRPAAKDMWARVHAFLRPLALPAPGGFR